MKPLKNDIILKTIRPQGLIIIDPKEEAYPNKGQITAVGHEVTDLKIGDIVAFTKLPKADWKDKGSEYLLHNADDILAILPR